MSVDLLTGQSGITGHSRKNIYPTGGASGHRWYVAECQCGWTSELAHTQGQAAHKHSAHVIDVAEQLLAAEKESQA